MKEFFKSYTFKAFLAVLAVLLCGSILAALTTERESPFTSAVNFVFTPVNRAAAKTAEGLGKLRLHFRSAAYYARQTEELKKKLAESREKVVDYEQLQQKVDLYEKFLEIKQDHPDYKFQPASNISSDASDLYGTMTLNRGSLHDVHVNDPVIYEKYLVGVVTAVSPTQCTVSTLLNPSVFVSAYEIRTREAGYVETTASLADNGLVRLAGATRTTAMSTGGIVCTSGTGGIFPKDLLIGEVTEITDATENISSYAIVQPYVDFDNLIDVFIITEFTR